MAYAISFGDKKELVWTIANIYTDWFIGELTNSISDIELINFIKMTTYVNGVAFDTDYGNDNIYRDKYLSLLKTKLNQIIQIEKTKNIDLSLSKLLEELSILVNKNAQHVVAR